MDTDNPGQQLAADIESALDSDTKYGLGLFDLDAQSSSDLQLRLPVSFLAAQFGLGGAAGRVG